MSLNEFIGLIIKNLFHINGFALSLALEQSETKRNGLFG